MITDIPDFSEQELIIVQESIKERYGHEIEMQLADAEIRPGPSASAVVEVPAIFRAERDANYIIIKLGNNSNRSQFIYRDYQQFGAGDQVFDDIGNCVTTTLQFQPDHEAKAAD